MVAPFYIYSRGIQLFFTICGLFTTSLQLYLLHQRKIKVEIKYYLHYCCLISLFFNIFNCIDPDGVFDIIPYLVISIMEGIVSSSLGVGFCLIIYGHFHAHYLSLKKDLPGGLLIILSVTTTLNIILSLLSTSLVYGLNLEIYRCLGNLMALLWLIIVISADLYSYYLVRKLILECIGMESSIMIVRTPPGSVSSRNETTSNTHTRKNTHDQEISYDNLLTRMRNFHVITTSLGIFFFILITTTLLTSVQAGNNPPIYPNPNQFSFNYTGNQYIFYFIWLIFTWWSWINICQEDLHSSKETYLSKSDHISSSQHNHTEQHKKRNRNSTIFK